MIQHLGGCQALGWVLDTKDNMMLLLGVWLLSIGCSLRLFHQFLLPLSWEGILNLPPTPMVNPSVNWQQGTDQRRVKPRSLEEARPALKNAADSTRFQAQSQHLEARMQN